MSGGGQNQKFDQALCEYKLIFVGLLKCLSDSLAVLYYFLSQTTGNPNSADITIQETIVTIINTIKY